MEVTRVLPPGKEQDLDCGILAKLIRSAIYRTLEDLKHLPIPQRPRVVFRGDEREIRDYEILAPSYRDPVVWDRVAQIWRSEESVALTDYIWGRGALKKTLTGPNPNKDAWARFVYGDFVHHPLLVAIEDTARERLVDGGISEAWTVDLEKIEKAVADIVTLYCERRQLVTAVCPLSGLDLPYGACLEIAPDIKLRRWTPRDLCLFLSRHHHEFLWDDFKSPVILGAIAEVSFPIEIGNGIRQEDVTSMVQDRIDLPKWALFVTLGSNQPVAEGTCLIKGILDVRMGRFRRDENIGPAGYLLDELTVNRCTDLIQRFRDSTAQGSDLNQALWHFGRACVATQPREILLESAIGLDLLLVPGPGESRYRFCLHGAAILSTNTHDGTKLFKTLQEIYNNRSRAAHGRRASEVEKIAPDSRKMLAEAIRTIVDLVLAKKLDPIDGIAKAVEQYVLQRATS